MSSKITLILFLKPSNHAKLQGFQESGLLKDLTPLLALKILTPLSQQLLSFQRETMRYPLT